MSEYSLYGKLISDTYPRILQLSSGDTLLDGSGNTRSMYVNDNLSADTIFIGSSNIVNLFAPLGGSSGSTTIIQNGTNIYTGGTVLSPTINITAGTFNSITVTGNSFFTSLSANTLFSGLTDLGNIFAPIDSIASLQTNQIGYGSSANTIISSTGLTYDGNKLILSSNTQNNTLFQVGDGITFVDKYNNFSDRNGLIVAGININNAANVPTINPLNSDLVFQAGSFGLVYETSTGSRFINGGVRIGDDTTPNFPLDVVGRINSDSLSATTISGGTLLSGSTNLYSIFAKIGGGDSYVQPGSNIVTGGTANAQIISLVDSPNLNGIILSGAGFANNFSATTLQGNTIQSGTTDIDSIFHRKGGYLLQKAGSIIGNQFSGTSRTFNVIFNNNFPTNIYSITVTGEASRVWTILNKANSGFTIDSNSDVAFDTQNVFWIACEIGEGYR